jgi:hypothetical protein
LEIKRISLRVKNLPGDRQECKTPAHKYEIPYVTGEIFLLPAFPPYIMT